MGWEVVGSIRLDDRFANLPMREEARARRVPTPRRAWMARHCRSSFAAIRADLLEAVSAAQAQHLGAGRSAAFFLEEWDEAADAWGVSDAGSYSAVPASAARRAWARSSARPHVAATRADDRLMLSGISPGSEFLDDIRMTVG